MAKIPFNCNINNNYVYIYFDTLEGKIDCKEIGLDEKNLDKFTDLLNEKAMVTVNNGVSFMEVEIPFGFGTKKIKINLAYLDITLEEIDNLRNELQDEINKVRSEFKTIVDDLRNEVDRLRDELKTAWSEIRINKVISTAATSNLDSNMVIFKNTYKSILDWHNCEHRVTENSYKDDTIKNFNTMLKYNHGIIKKIDVDEKGIHIHFSAYQHRFHQLADVVDSDCYHDNDIYRKLKKMYPDDKCLIDNIETGKKYYIICKDDDSELCAVSFTIRAMEY